MRIPDDGLPLAERDAVRLVVLDAASRLLLFHTHDPTYPELGTWWETPGGGIEPDETYVDAAMRELREETGIIVTADQVGPASWRRDATFRYRGERRLQHERVAAVRLTADRPAVDGSQRVGFEDEDYFDHRWWPQEALTVSRARFYPGRLPDLLPAFLAGDVIVEDFEVWS